MTWTLGNEVKMMKIMWAMIVNLRDGGICLWCLTLEVCGLRSEV